jgi:hypothetical protein
MTANSQSPNPAEPYNKTKTLAVTCVWILAIVAIVIAGGCLFLRKPHFSGTKATTIAFTFYTSEGRTPPSFASSPTSALIVTNESTCASILAALREGRLVRDHPSTEIASLLITYTNGKTNELRLLPRNSSEHAAFRHGVLRYALPNDKLFAALQAAGVDLSKLRSQP